MSILEYFCFIILVIIILLYLIILTEKRYYFISIVLLVAAICLSFISTDIGNAPTALDVYEGNTELRITYEGKVPVDSVVIYKKKVHETE